MCLIRSLAMKDFLSSRCAARACGSQPVQSGHCVRNQVPGRRQGDAARAMDAIAQTHHAPGALAPLMSRVCELIATHAAHPARTVVLLPFAHLLQPAREAW